MNEQVVVFSLVALIMLPLLLLQIVRAPRSVRMVCMAISALYFVVGGLIFYETRFALLGAFGGATIAALGFSLYKKLVVSGLKEQLAMVSQVVSYGVSEFRNLSSTGADEIFAEDLILVLNRGTLSKHERKIVRHMLKYHSDIGHDSSDGKQIAAYPAMVPAITHSINFPDLVSYEKRLKESCKRWSVGKAC